jgi:biopolymer transport protein ExbB
MENNNLLFEVVFGGGFLSVLIWILLFLTSTAVLAVGIKLLLALRRKYFIDHEQTEQLTELCTNGELQQAFELVSQDKSTLAVTMSAAFKNYHRGEKEREDAATAVIDKTTRALLRQINTLQMCGNIAPMLGLLGTVTGMVSAFMGLWGLPPFK